jgi:bacterioferritin-associated ferredoxin
LALFLLIPPARMNIQEASITRAASPVMIVCSCNVLSDQDVRAAMTAASDTPRTAKQVYGCLGCSAECGRCARTIKQIMTEALTGALTEAIEGMAPCAAGCCSGCPHSHAQNHAHDAEHHQVADAISATSGDVAHFPVTA